MDKNIICDFGSIKFKARIVIKTAWYGIKIYVVTDAETAFTPNVLIYNGKYNDAKNDNIYMLKTVKVVCELYNPFKGSYSTIFVYGFYISINFMKGLKKKHFM